MTIFQTPRHLGYFAFSQEASIDDNPYDDSTDEADQWARGYMLAEVDYNAWKSGEY